MRFMPDRAFPTAVRGPVDFAALRRLASSRACVIVGGLRSDMGPLPSVPAKTDSGSRMVAGPSDPMIHTLYYEVNSKFHLVTFPVPRIWGPVVSRSER